MTNCPCDLPTDIEREINRALNSIAAGQDALPRQVRTFAEVREALIQALSKPGREALAQWQARGSNDLGVMFLEMWAYVSDILSFYDERIANESYIRTAQRAISLRRHVEMLGYLPAPGVAGSVSLAAIAEGRKAVTLPAGTAFRSDAFDNEPPQVFEVTGETTIHPFKNEWTVGPIRRPTASHLTSTDVQLTPSQIEQQQRNDQVTAGEYLVFETLEFGLAVDRFALVTIGEERTGTVVTEIEPFAGRDGRTYAEVRFDPAVVFPDESPDSFKVQVPTVTGVVTRFPVKPEPNEPIPPPVQGPTNGQFTVYLDAVYRQIRPGDFMLVTGFEEEPHVRVARVVRAVERPVIVQDADNSPTGDDVTIPVTRVELSEVEFPANVGNSNVHNALTFHFAFVDGGRITTVPDTELPAEALVEGTLPVDGLVERPPELEPPASGSSVVAQSAALEQEFLLTDPDGNGAKVQGLMLFGANKRARLSIQDDPERALPAPRYKTPLSVFGNVVHATRGETVFNEVLGSGDARTPSQQFQLKKKPLTYLAAPNELGRESTLRVFVDGVQWREVRTFFMCRPENCVYTVRHDEEQNTLITFGDGVRGARLPSGVNNVIATYRFGSGSAAPPAGAISQLARTVLGMRSVRSPIATTPGKDPDAPETLRQRAPISARVLGSAVSVSDFEAIASLEAGVTRAIADFLWIPEQRAGVTVTYVGDRDPDDLRLTLMQRAEEGLAIKVVQAFPSEARLTLTIAVDPRFERQRLTEVIERALKEPPSGPLSPQRAPIGGQFPISPLFDLLHSIPGVVAVTDAQLVTVDRNNNTNIHSLGQLDVRCVPEGEFFDFTPDEALVIHLVDPTGPVTASREEGC